jgi:hypothetical protein
LEEFHSLAFDRTYSAPNFLCTGTPGKLFVEATTINPTVGGLNIDALTEEEYFLNYLPMKFWQRALFEIAEEILEVISYW